MFSLIPPMRACIVLTFSLPRHFKLHAFGVFAENPVIVYLTL